MSIMYGRGLPVIKLAHWQVEGGGGLPLIIDHTIALSIYHNLSGFRIAEVEEFDAAGVRMADSGRSLINHRAGFRWMLDFTMDTHFLPLIPEEIGWDMVYSRYRTEGRLELLHWWRQQNTLNVIRVFPWSDRLDIYFDAFIPEGGFVKTSYMSDNQPRTIAHQYQVSLLAEQLHTTKPSFIQID